MTEPQEPAPKRPAVDVRLVCEYLAAQDAIELPGSTPSDCYRANALAMRCMASLPANVWYRIVQLIQSGDVGERQRMVAEMRDDLCPDDPIPPTMWVWHRKNINPNGRPSGWSPSPGPTPPASPPPRPKGGIVKRVLRALTDAD